MAIKLAKNLEQNPERDTAFHLEFTDSTEYDLDYIVEYRNRQNPSAALVMEVKDDAEIARKAIEAIKEEIKKDVSTELSRQNVIDDILAIIQDVYRKHMALLSNYSIDYEADELDTDKLPFDVYREVKNRINEYLKDIVTKYHLSYTISAKGRDIKIGFSFDSDASLNRIFEKYLERYKAKYTEELTDVKEGGLAISNAASPNKIPVRLADEKKYLLDGELSKRPAKDFTYDENYSPKKGEVFWEDGILDNRDADDEPNVYDDLTKLEKTINRQKTELAERSETIDILNSQVEEQGETITSLQEDIGQHENTISSQNMQIESLESQVNSLNEQLENSQSSGFNLIDMETGAILDLSDFDIPDSLIEYSVTFAELPHIEITGEGNYEAGETVTITFEAGNGYTLSAINASALVSGVRYPISELPSHLLGFTFTMPNSNVNSASVTGLSATAI